MTSVKFYLKDAEGNLVETVQASFDDADIEVRRQFISAMARVRDTSLLKRGTKRAQAALTKFDFLGYFRNERRSSPGKL